MTSIVASSVADCTSVVSTSEALRPSVASALSTTASANAVSLMSGGAPPPVLVSTAASTVASKLVAVSARLRRRRALLSTSVTVHVPVAPAHAAASTAAPGKIAKHFVENVGKAGTETTAT